MGSYVLMTVGTSLLQGLRRASDTTGELPTRQSALALLNHEGHTSRACGAEVNSLALLLEGQELRVGVLKPPFRVHLLVSDTPEGEWSGEVLTSHISGWQGVSTATYERIAGLDGRDPKRFAHHGLRTLVKVAARCLAEARRRDPQAQCVINATGGYKAQISLAGLLGQALKVPVVYLFEQFAHCIELPPMPVDFDRSLWIENYSLFRALSEETIVSQSQLDRLDPDVRLRPLLDTEQVDGQTLYALSPVLELMHQTFECSPPARAEQPPASDVPSAQRLHLNTAEMAHAPKDSPLRAQQLARLSPVTRVENLRFVNTGRSFVKTSGTLSLDEFRVVYSDSAKGLELRVLTTCQTVNQREWMLEELRRLVADW
jgi:putative CRISPR-associated protein (TIGR02619 family)